MSKLEELTEAEEAYLREKCANDVLFDIALDVVVGDKESCVANTEKAIGEAKLDPLDVLNRGLIAGMDVVGPRFRDNLIFVPEVLISVRAMKGGQAVIYPLLVKGGLKPVGTVVIGTVKGDLHDVGKNLVAMMLEGANFKVVDLSIDQKPEAFVEAIQKHNPVIVGMSAMLTTTMMNMRLTIDAIAKAGLRDKVKIMIGGAPVSQAFADKIGADAYGDDSADAVMKAKVLLDKVGVAAPAAPVARKASEVRVDNRDKPAVAETMTSRQRMVAAMRGKPVDRAAVGTPNTTVTTGLQEHLGVFFPEGHLDHEKMVRLAEASHTVLGYDSIMPLFSSYTSAAALGVNVEWNDRWNMPGVRTVLWKEPEDIVIPDDFFSRPSTSTVLKALPKLRRLYPDVAIVGKSYGPWSLAFHSFGIQNFLMMLALQPDKARRILHKLKEVPIMFAKAQYEHGIDGLKLVDHCSADLVSPKIYTEFLAPVHQEIHERLGGEVPIVLHACGRTLDFLPDVAKTGLEGFNIDTVVDPVAAKKAVKGKVALWGGVNNPQTMLDGSYDDVKRDVYKALDAGYDVIGPECTVPLNCDFKSIASVVEAVRDYYRDGRVPGNALDAAAASA